MVTTINAYSVSLGLDSSNYIDSSKLSREETAALKRDINSARDPMENLQRHQDRLTKALNEGAISVDVYNRLMSHYTDKMQAASGATAKQASSLDTFSKVGNVITGIRQGLMLVGDAVGFVTDKFEAFNQITNSIDDANDAAKKLGLSFNELGSLQFAASRLGGADAAGAIDKALGQMLKRGLVEPGESAVDAFKRVADQVQNAATQTERAQIAADAFGKSGIEILAVLQSGSDEIENLVSQWEKTNSLTDAQLAGIEEFNDRWDDVAQTVTGVRNIFASELAQAFTTMSDQVLGIDTSFQSVTALARDMADMIVGYVGMMKDASSLGIAVARLGVGDIAGAMTAFEEGIQFNSAEEMLLELEQKRAKLQKDANDAYLKRIKIRTDLEKDGIEEVNQKKLEAIEKADDALTEAAEKQWLDEMAREDALLARDLSAAQKSLSAKSNKPSVASMEVGSAEAAKFMADLANAGIESNPTEEEILAEAVKQREIMEQQRINDEAMKEKLQELIEVSKENGFRRLR